MKKILSVILLAAMAVSMVACKVTVENPVKDIEVPGELKFTVGDEAKKIEAKVVPEDAVGYEIQYESSDEKIATVDEDGKKVLLTEDLRNGNGRAIKSRIWSPNRVDKIPEHCDAVIWLMKDATLPPVLKITDPTLASVMGATLATKRTTAERLAAGVDPNALVVEPYANPFRTYPLSEDYAKFKQLFEERGVACYILNTGFFLDKKISKETTLGTIEKIVENKADFKPFGNIENMYCLDIDGFNADFSDPEYVAQLKARMADRIKFIKSKETAQGGFDKLPDEACAAIEKVASEIK